VANCGAPLQAAVAAGISAIGEHHGGAGEACAKILQEALQVRPTASAEVLAGEIVAEFRAAGQRLPGFGHRFHDPDPRAERLLALAEEWGLSSTHVALARAIVAELKAATGRSLPLNVDGALAALISDLGIDWRYGKALFIIGRTAGLVTHVHEELMTGKPFKFAARVEADYIGPAERPLPAATLRR
jgi:citrate synthase